MEFLEDIFLRNTLTEWLMAVGSVVLAIILGRLSYWFISRFLHKWAQKTSTQLDDILIERLREPLVLAIVIGGMWIGIKQLNTNLEWNIWLNKGFIMILTLDFTWLMVRFLNSVANEIIKPAIMRNNSGFAETGLPVILSIINIIIWITAGVLALNYVGYNVSAILAGFGIGGLAFAVAANHTISNLLGGITIIFVQPFRVGDRIRIDNQDGFVENIGLSYSRIRTFIDDTVVVIPNKHFSDKILVNVSEAPARRVLLKIMLHYDNSPAKVEQALNILRHIAVEQPGTTEHCKIAIDALHIYGIEVKWYYYVYYHVDLWDTQSAVTLQVYQQFTDAGIRFSNFTSGIIVNQQSEGAIPDA